MPAGKPSRAALLGLLALIVGVGAAQQWWALRQADAVGAQVAARARDGDIRMLSSQTCSICAAARDWFKRNRIAYSECSIETDAACRLAYEALGAPGTPVMQLRGAHHQLGFSPVRLQAALQARG